VAGLVPRLKLYALFPVGILCGEKAYKGDGFVEAAYKEDGFVEAAYKEDGFVEAAAEVYALSGSCGEQSTL